MSSNDNVWFIIIGALLAIVGGYVGDELRSWRERSRECKAIQVCLADELQEIESTIGNMHQVWEQAQLLPPTYVTTLIQGTSAYDNMRPRLFLISDEALRKEINNFYKKLKDLSIKADGRLGTLAQTDEATSERSNFDTSFQSIASEAKSLRSRLR